MPTQLLSKPTSGHKIHTAVFVDIQRNRSEIIEILAICGLLPKPVTFAEDGVSIALVEVEKVRSEEHTSELQSLMRISYAVFCLKNKNNKSELYNHTNKPHNHLIMHN